MTIKNAFKVGKTYAAKKSVLTRLQFTITVLKRTPKFVTFQFDEDESDIRRRKVAVEYGVEKICIHETNTLDGDYEFSANDVVDNATAETEQTADTVKVEADEVNKRTLKIEINPDGTGGESEITQAEKIAALEYKIECIINKRQDRLDELEDAEANDDIAPFVIDQLNNEIDALTDEYWKYLHELENLQKNNVPDTDSDTPAEIDAAEYAITEDAFNFAVEYEIEEAAIVAGLERSRARILANDDLIARYYKAKTQVKYERYENGYCGWYFKGKNRDNWECNVTKATACLTRYGLSRFEFAILSENEPAVIDNNGYDETAFELLPTVDELNDADTGLPLADGEVEYMGDAQAILVATFIDGTSEGKCFETADAAIAFARKCEKDSLIKRGYVMGDDKHYGNEVIYEFSKRTQAILNDELSQLIRQRTNLNSRLRNGLLTAEEFNADAGEVDAAIRYVELQIDALKAGDTFNYAAAAEHLKNIYGNVLGCIDDWKLEHGLSLEQCEQIYVAAHIDRNFDTDVDRELINRMIDEFKRANAENFYRETEKFYRETESTFREMKSAVAPARKFMREHIFDIYHFDYVLTIFNQRGELKAYPNKFHLVDTRFDIEVDRCELDYVIYFGNAELARYRTVENVNRTVDQLAIAIANRRFEFTFPEDEPPEIAILSDELDKIGNDICDTKDILERKIAAGAPQSEIKELAEYIAEREGEYYELHKQIYGTEPESYTAAQFDVDAIITAATVNNAYAEIKPTAGNSEFAEKMATLETVINKLKAEIERGDSEFTFPTVDELTAPDENEKARLC